MNELKRIERKYLELSHKERVKFCKAIIYKLLALEIEYDTDFCKRISRGFTDEKEACIRRRRDRRRKALSP